MENGENWSANHYNSGEQPAVLIVDSDAHRLNQNRDDEIKKLRKEFSKTKKGQQNLPNVETIQFMSINYEMTADVEDQDYISDVYRDVDSLAILKASANMEILPPADLPESYVGLGSVDLVIMSIDELGSLKSDQPTRFDAIDSYIRNGGNLIVFGEIGLQRSMSDLFGQNHVWTLADPGKYYQGAGRTQYYNDIAGEDRTVKNRNLKQELKKLPAFSTAGHGLGRIVISDAEDPFQFKPTYWRFMTQQIGSNRLSWMDRHGINLQGDNSDFWDFLIPGYGATPVVSFLTVITLFVLCIGPVNFYFLKRIKRFYLLPITVILAAIATTTVMMVYALLSDGVQRRVRLRSFTMIDQKTDGSHIASTHCRHSLFGRGGSYQWRGLSGAHVGLPNQSTIPLPRS